MVGVRVSSGLQLTGSRLCAGPDQILGTTICGFLKQLETQWFFLKLRLTAASDLQSQTLGSKAL